MDIHPIRNQRDHVRALREIERLWGAPPRTPAADKLEVLVTLVDAYESRHHPIDPPDPIDAIRFRLEQMGLLAEIWPTSSAAAPASPRSSTAAGHSPSP